MYANKLFEMLVSSNRAVYGVSYICIKVVLKFNLSFQITLVWDPDVYVYL